MTIPQENDDALAPKGTPKTHKAEPPKKMWWFRRDSGEVIPVSEVEAFQILKGGNAYHKTLKLVGVSSGVVFAQAVKDAHAAFREFGIERSQEILRAGHDAEYQSGLGNMERPRNQEQVTYDERQSS